MEEMEYLWKDRKRFLGMPLSFTRYRLSDDRLFCETGFLNVKSDEVLLYRVRDLRLTMSLGQRIFGVGTVCVVSSDKSIPHLDLKNVKDPRAVKELSHNATGGDPRVPALPDFMGKALQGRRHHSRFSIMACSIYSLDLPSKCPRQVPFASRRNSPSLS